MKTITLNYKEAEQLSLMISCQFTTADGKVEFFGLLTENIKEYIKRKLKIINKQLGERLSILNDTEKTEEVLAEEFELMVETVPGEVLDFIQTKALKINYNHELLDKIIE